MHQSQLLLYFLNPALQKQLKVLDWVAPFHRILDTVRVNHYIESQLSRIVGTELGQRPDFEQKQFLKRSQKDVIHVFVVVRNAFDDDLIVGFVFVSIDSTESSRIDFVVVAFVQFTLLNRVNDSERLFESTPKGLNYDDLGVNRLFDNLNFEMLIEGLDYAVNPFVL